MVDVDPFDDPIEFDYLDESYRRSIMFQPDGTFILVRPEILMDYLQPPYHKVQYSNLPPTPEMIDLRTMMSVRDTVERLKVIHRQRVRSRVRRTVRRR